MDDAEPKRRADHGYDAQNLGHGHFGRAQYDHEITHTWSFLRQDGDTKEGGLEGNIAPLPNGSSAFRLLRQGIISTLQQETRRESKVASGSHANGPHLDSCRQPDLVLASSILTSEALADPPSGLSAPVGEQIACGYIPGQDVRGRTDNREAVPVVVWTAGTNGDELFIQSTASSTESIVKEASFGSRSSMLELNGTAVRSKSSSKLPILQICVSEHGGANTMIGIRRATVTTLVRPALTRESHAESLSAIKLVHVLDIPMSRTGGYPHAHIAVDAGEENRFAIVDTQRNWSVWKLSGHASRSAHVLARAQLQVSGPLSPGPHSKTGLDVNEDGWHCVCWLGKKSVSAGRSDLEDNSDFEREVEPTRLLLVCSRRTAELFGMKGELLGQVDVRLGSGSAKNRILDVQASALDKKMCFILTSTRILVMSLTESTSRDSLRLICSWTHFRGNGDVTLRITAIELTDGTRFKACTSRYLLLSSKRSKEATIYKLRIEGDRHGQVVTASDPASFPLPEQLTKYPGLISDLTLQPLRGSKRNRTQCDSDDQLRQFFSLVAKMEDGSVLEAAYEYGTRQSAAQSDEPFWPGDKPVSSMPWIYKSFKYVGDDDGVDDFVVSDPPEETASILSLRQRWTRWQQLTRRDLSRTVKRWSDVHPGERANAGDVDLVRFLDHHSSGTMMQELSMDSVSQTLAAQLSGVYVDDIEEASTATDTWLRQAAGEADRKKVGQVKVLPRVVPTTGYRTLMERYNALMASHVGALSAETSDRLRVNTERVVRQVALETFLAGIVWRRREGLVTDPRDTPASQPLIMSGTTLADDDTTNDALSRNDNQASGLSVLSRYTTVKQHAQPASRVGAVSEVLAHLPTELSDPSEYSYMKTQSRLDKAKKQQNLEPWIREKIARQEKRKQERSTKRREEIAARATRLPTTVMSSQLAQPGSSQVAGMQMPMTQPERGIHGGRDKMSMIGRRKAGF